MKYTLLAALLLSLSAPQSRADERPLAPEIKGKSTQDELINVADYKGKTTIILFWATWCAPCKKAIPEFIKIQEEIGEDKIQIIAINMDDAQTRSRVKSTIKRNKWKMPIILDTDGTIAKKINSTNSAPYTVVIDKQGKIAYSEEGYTSDNAEKWAERLKKLSTEP
ncbi:TlpA family protein disulfide reductase [Myxococcota bacterium]|nr:TlpA family protein disulfide reductase [Myxococcota bacterium]MBU1428995.1 TlpA family protein disulfide reductase [Myxococcota bacterium]MBU1900157.1 TlpA family protein disulfide reductase [Myxococcota bacterium]